MPILYSAYSFAYNPDRSAVMETTNTGRNAVNLSALNERQREAVLHGDGPLLILAGAGTGKTRTIACRIAHLVEQGVRSGSILAVAFTNKSAEELRGRVQGILRGRSTAPLVSTFHSFCVRILREDIERLGYKKNFTIYDTADQLAVIREVAREVQVSGRDLDAKRLLWIISKAKNDGLEPDPGGGDDEYRLLASALYGRYCSALKAYNALDFDDLLLLALRLFEKHPAVLERWKERVRHILVDEFQDTNSVQYDLVRKLAGERGNLTVVGDDDQSIYGWRGAAPGNIFDFSKDWPGAQVITLDQNYRSTVTILKAANAVIEKNPGRRPKNLWSDLGEGLPVSVIGCASGDDEAEAVIEKIITLVASGRCRGGECAVLFRTNAQSRLFEDVLRRERVRYVVIGGMRFYDRKEVRDLLAYLSFLHNPRDEVSLLRVINYPARGIGRETIHRLQEESLRSRLPLLPVMEKASDLAGVGQRQAKAISRFLAEMKEMRPWFKPGRLAEPAASLIKAVGLEETVLRSMKDPELGMRKAENLREVVTALSAFEQQQPRGGLGDYLVTVNLSGREEEGTDLSAEAVSLLTVHAAKGLEFPHVFLAGLEENLFPHERSSVVPGGLEEERRLAYVGMTRARISLTLTYAASRRRWAKEYTCSPSRFLDELPEEGVEHTERSGPVDPSEEERIAEEYMARIRRRF
jgi:superfamily I DNA/RNA helicase